MKKLAILTLVMVFALSSVSFAAPTFGGQFEASSEINLQNYLSNTYGDSFKLTLSAAEENVWGLDVVLKNATVKDFTLNSAGNDIATGQDPTADTYGKLLNTAVPTLKIDQYKLSVTGGYVAGYAWKHDDQELAADLADLFGAMGTDNRLGGDGKFRVETTDLVKEELGFKAGLQLDGTVTLRGEVPFGSNSVGFIANTAGGQGAGTKYIGFGTVAVGPATIKAEYGQNTGFKENNAAYYASAKFAGFGVEGLSVEGKYYNDDKNAFKNKKGYSVKGTYELGNIQVVGEAGQNDRIDEQKVLTKQNSDRIKLSPTLDETTLSLSATYRTSATEDEPAFADIFGDDWNTNKGLAVNAKVEYAKDGDHSGITNTAYGWTDEDGTVVSGNYVLPKEPKTKITVQAVAPVTESIVALGKFVNTSHKDPYYLFEDRAWPSIINGDEWTLIVSAPSNQIYGAVSAKLTEKLTSTSSVEMFSVAEEAQKFSLLTLSETLKYAYTDKASLSLQIARDTTKVLDLDATSETWAKAKLSVSF